MKWLVIDAIACGVFALASIIVGIYGSPVGGFLFGFSSGLWFAAGLNWCVDNSGRVIYHTR